MHICYRLTHKVWTIITYTLPLYRVLTTRMLIFSASAPTSLLTLTEKRKQKHLLSPTKVHQPQSSNNCWSPLLQITDRKLKLMKKELALLILRLCINLKSIKLSRNSDAFATIYHPPVYLLEWLFAYNNSCFLPPGLLGGFNCVASCVACAVWYCHPFIDFNCIASCVAPSSTHWE